MYIPQKTCKRENVYFGHRISAWKIVQHAILKKSTVYNLVVSMQKISTVGAQNSEASTQEKKKILWCEKHTVTAIVFAARQQYTNEKR